MNFEPAILLFIVAVLQGCGSESPKVDTAPSVEILSPRDGLKLNILQKIRLEEIRTRPDPEGQLIPVFKKGSLILSASETVTGGGISSPEGNFSVIIPPSFERLAPGKVITFTAMASSPQSAPLYVGYTTLGAGGSGWKVLELTGEPSIVKFNYAVKNSASEKIRRDLLVFTNRTKNSTIKLDRLTLEIKN